MQYYEKNTLNLYFIWSAEVALKNKFHIYLRKFPAILSNINSNEHSLCYNMAVWRHYSFSL